MVYITRNNLLAEKGEQTHLQASNNANQQSGVVVGITAASAACGAFFIPKSYGTSIRITGCGRRAPCICSSLFTVSA